MLFQDMISIFAFAKGIELSDLEDSEVPTSLQLASQFGGVLFSSLLFLDLLNQFRLERLAEGIVLLGIVVGAQHALVILDWRQSLERVVVLVRILLGVSER